MHDLIAASIQTMSVVGFIRSYETTYNQQSTTRISIVKAHKVTNNASLASTVAAETQGSKQPHTLGQGTSKEEATQTHTSNNTYPAAIGNEATQELKHPPTVSEGTSKGEPPSEGALKRKHPQSEAYKETESLDGKTPRETKKIK